MQVMVEIIFVIFNQLKITVFIREEKVVSKSSVCW